VTTSCGSTIQGADVPTVLAIQEIDTRTTAGGKALTLQLWTARIAVLTPLRRACRAFCTTSSARFAPKVTWHDHVDACVATTDTCFTSSLQPLFSCFLHNFPARIAPKLTMSTHLLRPPTRVSLLINLATVFNSLRFLCARHPVMTPSLCEGKRLRPSD